MERLNVNRIEPDDIVSAKGMFALAGSLLVGLVVWTAAIILLT